LIEEEAALESIVNAVSASRVGKADIVFCTSRGHLVKLDFESRFI